MLFFVLKALHIIAVISWMAGILYLFRLLVYHSQEGQTSEDNHKLLSVMEERLYRFITLPALMVTWVAGLAMVAIQPAIARGGWFPVKFLLVIALTVVTVKAKKMHLKFKNKEDGVPETKKLRIWNEVPTIIMVIIVFLVVLKPF